jgi:hypothetical protein
VKNNEQRTRAIVSGDEEGETERPSPRRSATEEALLAMLRENTGRHFLDSGDAYGRHWQRNQTRDLENEPESTVSFKYGSIQVEHSVYHWLRDRLDFDEEATKAFDGPFREECDPENDKDWGELREEFPAWFAKWRSRKDTSEDCPACEGGDAACEVCEGSGKAPGDDSLYAATGIYGDGEPITVNSYNEESALDQVILFTYFELRTGSGRSGNLGSYVVLQIHGGCDVRGGYTRPRVFTLSDSDELAIFDYSRGTIHCEREPDHWWSTDDAHHWYREGACGLGAGTQLESYERIELVQGDEEDPRDGQARAWVADTLCVTDAGEGLCPICGGRLDAVSR